MLLAGWAVVCGCVRENLDRNRAIEPRVAGFVHLSHPARADERQDLYGPRRAPAGKGIGRGRGISTSAAFCERCRMRS